MKKLKSLYIVVLFSFSCKPTQVEHLSVHNYYKNNLLQVANSGNGKNHLHLFEPVVVDSASGIGLYRYSFDPVWYQNMFEPGYLLMFGDKYYTSVYGEQCESNLIWFVDKYGCLFSEAELTTIRQTFLCR